MFYDFPLTSIYIILILPAYYVFSAVQIADIRTIQERKYNNNDIGSYPRFIIVAHWMVWLTFLALIILNWKVAVAAFIIRFVLKVLPVLEQVGTFILMPVHIPPKSQTNYTVHVSDEMPKKKSLI